MNDETSEHECEHCGERVSDERFQLCGDCSQERADQALANTSPPEGGWPRNSTMGQI
jgi:hypothetical protein